MDEYRTKSMIIDSSLDACGIGHDVQERFRAAEKEISGFIASLSEKIHNQLVHDLLVNKPHGIAIGEGGNVAMHAIKSGAVSAIGALVHWDIYEAREFAGDVLQDVNDHGEAAKLYALAGNI